MPEKGKHSKMAESFGYAWHVIAPILLMVAAGFFARRVLPMDLKFYQQFNKLCFRIFLPVSLFCNTYKISDLGSISWKVLLFIIFGILLAVLIGVAVVRFVPSRAEKGVLVQASFRSNNTVIGLYIATALGGEAAEGFAVAALAAAVCLFNILAVVILEYYAGTGKKSIRETVRALTKNPLLIAIFLGLICILVRETEISILGTARFTLKDSMPSLYTALTDFSKVATPAMVFNLGALLDFKATKEKLGRIVLGISLRLVIVPLVCLSLAVWFRGALGITAVEFPALIAIFASPAAVAGRVMVAEIGGDSQLASQIIVWSTAFSMVTLFLFIFAGRLGGFI